MIDDVASFALSGSDAIKTNAIINSKVETKKLEFGASKCYNIHIGKLKDTHLKLKVHSDVINVKEYETYLGDIICSSGTNENNIEHRKSQGLAAINQITSILSLTSLGHFHFEIALILRDAILISKLVFNSEVWYNLTTKQIEKLEQIDEMFLRRILNVAKTSPKIGLYIECGKMPIRFIVKMRRILYLWHILTREGCELINKFYRVQNYSPSEGDWVLQIRKDMAEIKLNLSEEEISLMSRYKFKKLVKQKINECAISYLVARKKQKLMNLNIQTFEPQDYIISKNLSISEVQNLFKIRNSMVDVKENFKSGHENMSCRLCFESSESQSHLLDCPKIQDRLNGVIKFQDLKIEMAFQSLKNQELLARSYTIILNARKDMLSLDTGNH